MGTAFLFPGQGAQVVGMARDFHETFPEIRDLYAQANDSLDFDLTTISFEGPAETLNKTNVCQPAILVASLAARKALELKNPSLTPDATAGLSLGEYTALVCAGSLSLEDALRIVEKRGALMQEACDALPGTMASVIGLESDRVESIVADVMGDGPIGISNFNAPSQTVISGTTEAVEKAKTRCEEAGARRVIPLTVAGAYHSELMAPAREALAPFLREVEFRAPKIAFVSNVTGCLESDPDRIRELLIEQVVKPVRWEDSMKCLIEAGMTEAWELGPGRVLRGLMRRIDRDVTVHSIGNVSALEKEPVG